MIRKIVCDQATLEYQLIRKPVKNITLRIKPNGTICVSANTRVPVSYIDEFVKSKSFFIINALESYKKAQHDVSEPRQYVTGETLQVLGERLRLEVIQGKEEHITANETTIFLTIKDKETQIKKEQLIQEWLKEKQIEVFTQICIETHQLLCGYGITYPQITIRNMSSRWGSCRPNKGAITLNSQLIQYPRHCIEYVVLHEFAHFIHPNHSKAFYDFIETFMPDWKRCREELKKT